MSESGEPAPMTEPSVAIVTGAAARDGIGAAGARGATVRADLADPAAIDGAVDALQAELGEATILAHCAADLTRARLDELDSETLARVLAVNASAALLLARRPAPGMIRRSFGRIVTIASDTFDRPPGPGLLAYITSKGALIGATRALAHELGPHGVTANAVSPGLTRTGGATSGQPPELFDAVRAAQTVKRTLVPDDYAGLVAFLVSESAAAITGQTIRADAGLVMI